MDEPKDHVIMQGSFFWREGRCGYGPLWDAGLYTATEAMDIARGGRTPPDVALHVSEFAAEIAMIGEKVQRLQSALAAAQPSQDRRPPEWGR